MLKLKKSSSTIQIIIFLIFGWCLSVYLLSQWFICQTGASSCFKISSLANWDGQHFLQIAEKGYLLPYQLAFFPLYPILIKICSSILQQKLSTLSYVFYYIFKLFFKKNAPLKLLISMEHF
jgi:hypothetical protein